MKHTPLYETHLRLGARMVEFGGWEMPISYPSGIFAEHLATRKSGGLFDISHMGRFWIGGRDSLPFLQCVLTNNAAALVPGQAQYTMIPNESGGAIDDAYLYRVGEKEYILVVNAANAEKDWLWLQKFQPNFPGLVLEDHTGKMAMLALQGPRTKAALEAVLGDIRSLIGPTRNNLATTEIFGTRIYLSRTGYTGEPVGFELFLPADIAVRLWDELLAAGSGKGVVPVGLGARDTLRLEAGLPLYGHELGKDTDGKEIPALALPVASVAISFGGIKGEFVGREALRQQFQEIILRQEGRLEIPEEKWLVPRTIFPVLVCGDSVARAGCPVYVREKLAGQVTSGTVVPYWRVEGVGIRARPGTETDKRVICLAYLDADLREGQKVQVLVRDKVAEATIVRSHIGSEAAPYARPLFPEESALAISG
ncbi:MAG: glycine cleavage system protein T [Dehalococcoidales bacterium]|nr:glycine cleavage system protein T [Dehalococcoidales bacterium]MDP6448557.1 glycine cleavage system aminomethyltransferase GcvT [Dehalococcoidales bacterium]MDP6577156.1 glycine cleavage system aminomethyltransferase GcvT [Dehalococcoidales bacterium]MDP6825278.1 glycine cleavage system aminomethyltransferase GcvT [Dehalococcoidales bacterium]